MSDRITHSVFFRLKHPAGSAGERDFLDTCLDVIKPIPGVNGFRMVREVSPKNRFTFGLSMVFDDRAAYNRYNQHPAHVDFVKNTWIPNVEEFQEIDYVDI